MTDVPAGGRLQPSSSPLSCKLVDPGPGGKAG